MSLQRYRLPISTRHAFALAFDLAVRRDPVHSLVVPLLLRAPWIMALALLPPLDQTEHRGQVLALSTAALIGDFVMLLVISAMQRFRARSVFNTPSTTRPAPVLECYAEGFRRVPWLLVTEIVRNLALVVGAFFLLLPGLFVGFRLAFSTEAVVLNEPHIAGAFKRSFSLTEGRFERWLEMIVLSVVLVFSAIFLGAALSLAFPDAGMNVWVAVTRVLVTALIPIIQYAWTFFYLRLVEVEALVPGIEFGPLYANAHPTVPVTSPEVPTAEALPPEPPAREDRPPEPTAFQVPPRPPEETFFE